MRDKPTNTSCVMDSTPSQPDKNMPLKAKADMGIELAGHVAIVEGGVIACVVSSAALTGDCVRGCWRIAMPCVFGAVSTKWVRFGGRPAVVTGAGILGPARAGKTASIIAGTVVAHLASMTVSPCLYGHRLISLKVV